MLLFFQFACGLILAVDEVKNRKVGLGIAVKLLSNQELQWAMMETEQNVHQNGRLFYVWFHQCRRGRIRSIIGAVGSGACEPLSLQEGLLGL